MTFRRFIAVWRQEGMYGGKIRVSRMSKPTDTLDKAVIGLPPRFKSGWVVALRRLGNSVDGNARLVRGSSRCLIPVMHREAFDQVGCKTGLFEIDCNQRWGYPPQDLHTKEPA
jgi:hypothetical protein